jgi:hypothetical protein
MRMRWLFTLLVAVGVILHLRTGAQAGETFRIAGTAVDTAGKPVAGAVVECLQEDILGLPIGGRDMVVTQRLTTGTNGAFEFRVSPRTTVLLGRKPGLAPAWTQYWSLTKDLTDERLTFAPPTTLAGVVVDEADKPVADAEVSVSIACSVNRKEEDDSSWGYLSGRAARECFSARTAADGKFVLHDFPSNAGTFLAVTKPGKALRESARESVGPETMGFQAGQQDIRLVVEPAGSVEGKVVVQETGQPLAGMSLVLQAMLPGWSNAWSREPAQSGADGTFRFTDVAAGDYRLRAAFGTNRLPQWVA